MRYLPMLALLLTLSPLAHAQKRHRDRPWELSLTHSVWPESPKGTGFVVSREVGRVGSTRAFADAGYTVAAREGSSLVAGVSFGGRSDVVRYGVAYFAHQDAFAVMVRAAWLRW